MSTEDIHALGLREVKRIHKEMIVIKNNVGFTGSLNDFFIELKENDNYYYSENKKGS